MNNKDNFVIMRMDKGQWFCLNKIRRYILFLIISAIYYPCIVAQAGMTLQSNKIPGIEYRAGGYLHPELLTWGKVNNKGPFILVAGNKESFSVEIDIYKEIPAGNQIGVFLHFVSDLDPFQITDPAEPNFFTCESDDVDFNIQAFPNPVVHGSGSFFPYSKWAEIKLLNTAKPGAKLLLKFNNSSMQTYEETLFNIRFAVITDNNMTGYLGDANFEVVGDKMHHLRLLAPTCQEPFIKADCKIIVLDRNENKSGLDFSNLKFRIRILDSDRPLDYENITYNNEKRYYVVKGLKFKNEGVYYLEASVNGKESISGISNPIIVRKSWSEKVYFGDLHQHVYLSDGRGVPAGNLEYAISTGCLDFVCPIDHEFNYYGEARIFMPGSPRQNGGEELVTAADKYNGPDLITLTGSEISSPFVGHINKYYLNINSEDAGFLFGKYPKNNIKISNFQEYLDIIEKEKRGADYLILPHAHAGVGSAKYQIPKLPEHITNIEICSAHGIFEENYKGWLAAGNIVGVHGSGDNHMTNVGIAKGGYHYPNTNGLAGVYTSSRSRQGIWNGIKMRRTYAVTASQRIFLDFSINKSKMGEVCNDIQSKRNISVEVAGTSPIYKIELLKNNKVVETFKPGIKNNNYFRLNWYDDINSRRVNDSRTTGSISAQKGNLELINGYNGFNKSDIFKENAGIIEFRTNAYSGTPRGVIIKTNGADQIDFIVDDVYLDKTILKDTLQIDLTKLPVQFTKVLLQYKLNPYTFEKGTYFYLDADQVDPYVSKTATINWQEKGGDECYYYVRVEQLDGTFAWSSPIWFKNKPQ